MKITSIHIYIIITIAAAFWCSGIIAAPILKHFGYIKSAGTIYSFFSRICHQNDAHSFHIEGEKIGVCIRCTSIYFGFLAGLILLPVCSGLNRKHLPNKYLLFAAALPTFIDVAMDVSGLHASSTLTRIITGIFFGGALSWWIVPLLIEACLQLIEKRKNNHQIQE